MYVQAGFLQLTTGTLRIAGSCLQDAKATWLNCTHGRAQHTHAFFDE